jgi:hypothetical protein
MVISQKTENRTATQSGNPTSENTAKESEIIVSKRHLHAPVYYSTIHNRQDMG